MTAITMFADERRAYLITDGAQFDSTNGRIVGFDPKVVVFDKVRMAIALQGGMVPVTALCDAMNAICRKPTQAAFLACLPTALADARANLPRQLLNHTRLWVATFDAARRAPRMFTVQSGPMPDGQGQAFNVEETEGGVTGLRDLSGVLPAGWPADPVSDGLKILAAQRAAPFADLNDAGGMGGQCTLYAVGRRGVRFCDLIQYPDRLGDRINTDCESSSHRAGFATGGAV